MEFRSQRKLRHRKLKGRKFTFCDFTAFFAGDVLLWSAYDISHNQIDLRVIYIPLKLNRIAMHDIII